MLLLIFKVVLVIKLLYLEVRNVIVWVIFIGLFVCLSGILLMVLLVDLLVVCVVWNCVFNIKFGVMVLMWIFMDVNFVVSEWVNVSIVFLLVE